MLYKNDLGTNDLHFSRNNIDTKWPMYEITKVPVCKKWLDYE